MRTPPKGCRLPRLRRSVLSIACIMSARTIDTSSITIVSMALHQALVADLAGVARIQQARREVEEGMDRLPADIDRRQPRRRQHHRLLQRFEDQLAQQRRLPRAGAAGEEDVAPPVDDLGDQRGIDIGCRLGAHQPVCLPESAQALSTDVRP